MSVTTAVAPLTTEDAEVLLGAAREAAEAAGIAVSVTVLDAGGHPLAFRRDDRAVLISGETSTRKAYTALQLNAPTMRPHRGRPARRPLPHPAHRPGPAAAVHRRMDCPSTARAAS